MILERREEDCEMTIASGPIQSRLTSLPNGLRIATCEVPYAETAAMGIWAGVEGGMNPPD